MLLFHTTDAADEILARGFRDAEGTYMTTGWYKGVWLAERPLDWNEGAKGSVVLVLDIPEEVIAPFEWTEEGKPYREFLVPADLVNGYGPARVHEDG